MNRWFKAECPCKLNYSKEESRNKTKQVVVSRGTASNSDGMAAAQSAAGPSTSKNDHIDLFSELYPSDEVSLSFYKGKANGYLFDLFTF